MTWRHRADLAIRKLAMSGREFTADDLLAEVGHPDGEHGANGRNNAVGAVFRDASQQRIIVAVGMRQSSQPHRKSGMIRVWRGQPAPIVEPKVVPAEESLSRLRVIRNQLADTISQLEARKQQGANQ